ncbi:MAG: S-layer homology domain-containing protein, partial [Thermoleophilia bacterium]|nr:S-layer homology domain-containing protein [Thermoleophilia bacterium]
MERSAFLKNHSAVVRRRTGLALLGAVALVAVLAVSAVSLALADTASFPDVPATDPHHAAIVDLASRGIVEGYTNGDFGPSDDVKRQQFAKMIVLAGGYPVSEADVCPFLDVSVSGPASLYPDNYVAVCAAAGITVGKTATTFDPYSSITRHQVVSMVMRAADDLRPGLLPDPPPEWTGTPDWGLDATHGANAARAEYNGLLTGIDLSNVDPQGSMPRGEVAQILYNLLAAIAPPATTTTTTSTTSTASSTTTTTAATTSTTAVGGGGGGGGGTTPSTTTPVPSVDYAIAGREAATVTAHVSDQFGNPFPGVEVLFTSEWPEGLAGLPELDVSAGVTDEFGNVAHSWEQTT